MKFIELFSLFFVFGSLFCSVYGVNVKHFYRANPSLVPKPGNVEDINDSRQEVLPQDAQKELATLKSKLEKETSWTCEGCLLLARFVSDLLQKNISEDAIGIVGNFCRSLIV